MTEYAPRGSQNYNLFYSNPHLAMSHYSNGNGDNMLYSNGQIQYSTVNGSYPTYSTTYVPAQHGASTSMYMPTTSAMAMQYQLRPSGISLPSQPLPLSHPSYYATNLSAQRPPHQSRLHDSDMNIMADTESQDSINDDTMLSEAILPPLEGYPDVKAFDELMKRYVADLSPKKQDKALIHARRAANIKTVLIDKKTTSVESAQFRFWVKKMFTLMPNDPKIPDRNKKICHEGKPVAVREKLFKILTQAHKTCQHGGRDKTSAQVRRVYSWVPKELISRFVKLCPTCQVRRGTTRPSRPESEKSPETYMEAQSPETISPASRRGSLATKHGSISAHSPLQMAGFSSTFQQQNRWMTPLHFTQDRSNRPNYDNSVSGSTTYPSQDGMTGLVQTVPKTLTSHSGAMSFLPVNGMSDTSASSGYIPSNLRLTNRQQSANGYTVKHYS